MDIGDTLRQILGQGPDEKAGPKSERDYYQEALVTELLRLLVRNSIITRAEAQNVIQQAKETARDRVRTASK